MRPIDKMKRLVQGQSVEILKESAVKLNGCCDGGVVDLAFEMVMDELENRMDEAEFVKFCDTL